MVERRKSSPPKIDIGDISKESPGFGLTTQHAPEIQAISKLTERERETLGLLAQGLNRREIASRTFLSVRTIMGVNIEIYKKLGVKNNTEATGIYLRSEYNNQDIDTPPKNAGEQK